MKPLLFDPVFVDGGSLVLARPFMSNKRLPYALIALGLLGMFLYPRALPVDSPPFMRTDTFIGFVYGICLGVEILGVIISKKQRQQGA
jgi:hypothetical protein